MDNDALFDDIVLSVASSSSKDSGCVLSCESTTSSTGTASGSLEDKSKEKTSDKQTKKQKLIEAKAARQAANEFNKIYKPGECMNYMTVEMHKNLIDMWYMSDVDREVSLGGARVSAMELFNDRLVLWSRTVQPLLSSQKGQLELTPSIERCNHALYVMTAEDAATYVSTHTLASHMTHIKHVADCRLSLLIFGVKDYFKASNRKKTNNSKKLMNEIELEMAIADLLVNPGCDTIILNTPNEIALTIAQFTKAIAETPYKKAKTACDEQAEFYMRGDNKKCVPVDKDGAGLSRLWQQMIAILPSSSLETSRTICARYKSPLELFEALESPDGVNELADLGVSRAAVPGSQARRIGPEFARKLQTLFTAVDGDALLD